MFLLAKIQICVAVRESFYFKSCSWINIFSKLSPCSTNWRSINRVVNLPFVRVIGLLEHQLYVLQEPFDPACFPSWQAMFQLPIASSRNKCCHSTSLLFCFFAALLILVFNNNHLLSNCIINSTATAENLMK